MMVLTRKLLIALCLVSDPHRNLSSAWVMVSPVPSLHRTVGTMRLWCDQISDGETSRSRRCMLQQLGLLFPAAVGIPVCAAEVDPFAAMDDIISAEIGANKPSVGTTPRTPATTRADSRDKEVTDSKVAPGGSSKSDMAAALQEAKQRKTIAPRTHG